MSEQRDRPQYGEYASVDEQIAAGGFAVEPDPVIPPAHLSDDRLPPPSASARVAGAPPTTRTWDLALTTALLVFGAYSIVSSIPELLNYGASMKRVVATVGVEGFSSIGLADGVGVAMLVTQSVVYVAAVVLSMFRLRARKIAFFIPVAGALLVGIVTLVLASVAMFSDPAVITWLNSQR